jgi:LysM repeat protein
MLFAPSSFYSKEMPVVTIENLISLVSDPKSQFQINEGCVGPIQSSCLESPAYYLVKNSGLLGLSPPAVIDSQVLGSLVGEIEETLVTNKEIIEYVVEPGDTFSNIANKFNVSLETLLWANDLSKNSKIKVGQGLIILPVSGIIHYVKEGDTLSDIAKKYKADVNEVISFNELSGEEDIYIGDILIIPYGTMPSPSSVPPKYVGAPTEVPVANSYFIPPLPTPYLITQGLHWYNAVDLTRGKCGDPIYAAAQGTVQKVGYDSVGGNHITILHPNGVVTYYGHLQTILVSSGQSVSQGQMIGLMGGQPGMVGAGISTGCHIHFGVIGAKNPFAK